MIAVVASAIHDPVLKRDAESLGATFLQKPIATDRLLAALSTAARR